MDIRVSPQWKTHLINIGKKYKFGARSLPSECHLNNPDFAYILGAGYGDGTFSPRTLEIEIKDADFAKRIKSAAERIGFHPKVLHRYRQTTFNSTPQKTYRAFINSTLLIDLVGKINISDLRNLSLECKKQFIIGFFDAEGCVFFGRQGKYLRRTLDCSNTNYELITLIKSFLDEFGITYSEYASRIPSGTAYRLVILTHENFERFYALGKLMKRKQRVLDNILHTPYILRRWTTDERMRLGLKYKMMPKRLLAVEFGRTEQAIYRAIQNRIWERPV